MSLPGERIEKYDTAFCASSIAQTVLYKRTSGVRAYLSWATVCTALTLQLLPATPALSKTTTTPVQKKSAATTSSPASTAKEQPVTEDPLKKAQAIIDKLSHLDHPETRVPRDSIGWQEEQQAAQRSTQSKIDTAQAQLIGMGNKITPVLAKNLNSSSKDVENVCTQALGLFGSASIPPLTETLRQFGPTAPVISAIKAVGPDMVPPILVMLNSSSEQERGTAIHTLNALLPDRNDPFYHVRSHAPRAISVNIHEPFVLSMPAVSKLCELTGKEKSVKMREELVQVLGRVGQRTELVSKTLMSAAENDEEPTVRASALVALEAIASNLNGDFATELATFLAKRLKKDDYEGCRMGALSALARLSRGAEIAVPAITEAIQDSNVNVAIAAINQLGAFGDQASTALPMLVHCIQSAPDSQEANAAM